MSEMSCRYKSVCFAMASWQEQNILSSRFQCSNES